MRSITVLTILILVAPALLALAPASAARLLGGEVLALSFDDGDFDTLYPGSVVDHSSFGGHATRVGGIQVTAGPNAFGSAMYDNGGNYVRVDTLGGVDSLASDFSVAMWIEPFNPTYSQGFFWERAADGNPTLQLQMLNGGSFYLAIRDPTGAASDALFTYATPADQWTHIAFVQRDTNLSFYANGVWQASAIRAPGIYHASPIDHLYLGSPDCCINAFYGAFDDVRVFDRAISAQEVLALEDAAPVVRTSAPVTIPCTGPLTSAPLDGSSSADANGDALTFAWSVPGAATLDDASAAATIGHFPTGTTIAQLGVSDGALTTTGTQTVTVTDSAPPAITDVFPGAPGVYAGSSGVPGGDRIVLAGPVDISAGASDACSAIAKIVFDVDDGTHVVDASAPFGFTYAPAGVGIQFRTLTITAYDTQGNHVSTSEALTVVGASVPS